MKEQKIRVVKDRPLKGGSYALAVTSMIVATICAPLAWILATMSVRRAGTIADKALGIVAQRMAVTFFVLQIGLIVWAFILLKPVIDRIFGM